MSCLTGAIPGNSQIKFLSNEEGWLSVTIQTEQLHIRSVEATEAEYDHYESLFGSKNVMEKFATGQTKTRDEIQKRIDGVWVKRWHERDPYSGFTIEEKKTKAFVGHIALGHGDLPGQAELAGLGNQGFWGKGYGSEAATAIVREYAPATIERGYLLKGSPLTTIVATARSDNLYSGRILEKIGMCFVHKEEKHGALRNHYSMALA